MAGSYKHCVTGKGKLRTPDTILLDGISRDSYEAIQEMYGMIWRLAYDLEGASGGTRKAADSVARARENYQEGLALSPGIQGRGHRFHRPGY